MVINDFYGQVGVTGIEYVQYQRLDINVVYCSIVIPDLVLIITAVSLPNLEPY